MNKWINIRFFKIYANPANYSAVVFVVLSLHLLVCYLLNNFTSFAHFKKFLKVH